MDPRLSFIHMLAAPCVVALVLIASAEAAYQVMKLGRSKEPPYPTGLPPLQQRFVEQVAERREFFWNAGRSHTRLLHLMTLGVLCMEAYVIAKYYGWL